MPVLIVTILQKDNHGGQDDPEEGLSLRLQKIAITIRKRVFYNPKLARLHLIRDEVIAV